MPMNVLSTIWAVFAVKNLAVSVASYFKIVKARKSGDIRMMLIDFTFEDINFVYNVNRKD